jgi:cytochrome c biogenesis protein CcmG/thiol:disulfide interchange protein DsbE
VAEEVARPSRTRRGRWIGAGAALVLAVAWAAFAVGAPPSSDAGALGRGTPVRQDRPAPAFARPLLSGGGAVSLGSYRGSVVVVNVWASYCRPCRTEAPRLAALARSFAGSDVRFLGVDYEDRSGAALSFARAVGLPYPSVVDADGSVGDAFRIVGLPMTFVIGADQRIRYEVLGRISPDALRAAIDAVRPPGAGSAT